MVHWWIHEGAKDAPPPWGPNCFNFMQLLEKNKGPFTPSVNDASANVTATSLRIKWTTSALFCFTK